MKTEEQIEKYLSNKKWFQIFETQTILHQRCSLNKYIHKIYEVNPTLVIFCAFPWYENSEFDWQNINTNFNNWVKTK